MSKIIVDDEGKELTVFTADEIAAAEAKVKAEYEAKLADKDAHVAEKLKEFQTGKTAQELKDAERDAKIAEAAALAKAANENAAQAEVRRQNTLKDIAMKKYVGENAELKAKMEANWALVNLEIKEDGDILKKAELVANMSGFNADNSFAMGGFEWGGGRPPALDSAQKAAQEASTAQFREALPGMGEFLAKPKTEEAK